SYLGCSQVSNLASSSPVQRLNGASPGSDPVSGRLTSTILPCSLPCHAAKCASLLIGATTTGPETAPLVAGVQVIGTAVSWIGRGLVIRTLERSIHQPRPNSKPSLWTLVSPHWRNWSCVHCSALRMPGELVRRGPITSDRYSAVCITCEWLVPSS